MLSFIFSFRDAQILVRVKLLKSDGLTPVEKGKVVSVNNNILHTLFSSVKLSLQDTPVNENHDLYMYKGYLYNLLGIVLVNTKK